MYTVDDFLKDLEETFSISYNDPRYHDMINELINEFVATKKINYNYSKNVENGLENKIVNGDTNRLYSFAENFEVHTPENIVSIVESYVEQKKNKNEPVPENLISIIESHNEEKNRLRK